MTDIPMKAALGRLCKMAFLRQGEFQLIEERGITPLAEVFTASTTADVSRRLATLFHILYRSTLVGTLSTPAHKRFEDEACTLINTSWRSGASGDSIVDAYDNAREARRLSKTCEETILPDQWQKKKVGVWVAQTPLGQVEYERLIEGSYYPETFLFVENGPVGALEPWKLFSISTTHYLSYEDIDTYGERYGSFLHLLNAFVTDLSAMGAHNQRTADDWQLTDRYSEGPMGNFYTNITLKGPQAQDVARLLESGGRTAHVAPLADGWTVVYDAEVEMQHPQIVQALTKSLSESLQCPALAVLNHDDDVLAYWLFVAGKLDDEYDSCPDGLAGGPDLKAQGGSSEKLCSAFGADGAVAEVETILRAPGASGGGGYVFAIERHHALAQALGLPECSVGYGYMYLEAGELPEDFDEEDLISIG